MAKERNAMHVVVQPIHSEVTGSCFMLKARFPSGQKEAVIVDCGLFQERETLDNNLGFPFKPNVNNISMVLLTHAHIDHIGRIPLLHKKGYRGDIFTSTLKETIRLQLEDTAKINKLLAKQRGEKALFTEKDVEGVMQQVKVVKYTQTISKKVGTNIYLNEHIKATFFPNAHTPGAALILLQFLAEGQETINFLFTGDYRPKDDMIKTAPMIPEKIRKSLKNLHIISEATYGQDGAQKRKSVFRKNVKTFFEQGGKVLLIPTFAYERAQKILYTLKKMQNSGGLKKSIPIYTDGNLLHSHTYNLCINSRKLLRESAQDFLPENFHRVPPKQRDTLIPNAQEPMIIVTTSGSGMYGPSQLYITQLLEKHNCMIHFTGFQFKGSFGEKLRDALENSNGIIKIRGEKEVKIRCKVACTNEFSAHATRKQLVNLYKKFPNVNTIYLNHGAMDAKRDFANYLVEEEGYKEDNIIISSNEYYSKFNAYKCYAPYCRSKIKNCC